MNRKDIPDPDLRRVVEAIERAERREKEQQAAVHAVVREALAKLGLRNVKETDRGHVFSCPTKGCAKSVYVVTSRSRGVSLSCECTRGHPCDVQLVIDAKLKEVAAPVVERLRAEARAEDGED